MADMKRVVVQTRTDIVLYVRGEATAIACPVCDGQFGHSAGTSIVPVKVGECCPDCFARVVEVKEHVPCVTELTG